MMGRPRADALAQYKELLEIPLSVEEIDVQTRSHLNELMPQADFMPGARRLVEHLHKHQIPMAIATGSDKQSFAIKTGRNQSFFDTYFSHVVLSCDPEVKSGKPAPDIFMVAAQRFTQLPTDTSKCVVFEDAPLGVQGAIAAGMKCVWVPTVPIESYENLVDKAHMLQSLEHFQPEHFGLPPF